MDTKGLHKTRAKRHRTKTGSKATRAGHKHERTKVAKNKHAAHKANGRAATKQVNAYINTTTCKRSETKDTQR
jgi:predicted solute-binding protein